MERQFVLSNFPIMKLSYEKLIHKKVCTDFILAVPQGPKHFVWFTIFDNKNVCFLIELGERNANVKEQIKSVRIIKMPFYDNGTILYGTFLLINSQNFFTIEDIFYYKEKLIDRESSSWLNKFDIIGKFLENNVKQNKNQGFFGKPFLNFSMPLIHNNFEELMKMIESNKAYRVHNIAFRLKDKSGSLILPFSKINNIENVVIVNEVVKEVLKENVVLEKEIKFNQINILDILYNKPTKTNIVEKSNTIVNLNNSVKKPITGKPIPGKPVPSKTLLQRVKEQVLLVKPDIQNDIYHLYSYDELSKTYANYVGIASIPDYKTSVLLNNVFRNIKENHNLDALEESDDEDEFENNKEDRFVSLDKECKFNCVFNYKFKKWTPNQLLEKV
jgi:hypothetical protein